MAKSNSEQPQGVFSFFDDVEKTEPIPKPKRNTLRPPQQVEVEEVVEATENVEVNLTQEETVSVEEEVMEKFAEATVDEVEQVEAVEEQEEEFGEQPTSEPEPEIEPETVIPQTIQYADENAVEEELAVKKTAGTRGRRSVKENAAAADLIEIPEDEELFKKQYYSMGEVTTMFKENHSLIRYWESEFDILKPKKNGKGDRFFRPVDVKNLYLIYDLLRRRKFTIEGAREYLKNNKKAEEKFTAIQSLEKIKSFFLELKANL